MKVKELIRDIELPKSEAILKRIIELDAPKVLIESQKKWQETLINLTPNIYGNKLLLNAEVENHEIVVIDGEEEVIINGYIRYYNAEAGPVLALLDKRLEVEIKQKAVAEFLHRWINVIDCGINKKQDLHDLASDIEQGIPYSFVYEQISDEFNIKLTEWRTRKPKVGKSRK